MFEAINEFGECSFCGSSTSPAFINGSTDALGRLNRICSPCLASITLLIDLVPVEQVEAARARGDELKSVLQAREIELEAERAQLAETAATLAHKEAELVSARNQSSTMESMLIEERKRADEAERGIPSLAAIKALITEAQAPKTTTKRKATANV